MKADKYALISKYVLVALMLASVAVFALFFFFGEAKVLEVPAEMLQEHILKLMHIYQLS